MLLGIALGGTEIIVILVIALLVFGPSKLPQLGSSVGKMLRGFKSEMKALKEEADAEDNEEIDVSPAPRD